MGQKVNPIGLRVGITRTWDSCWYADKNYAEQFHEDIKIRKYIKTKFENAEISKIVVERFANRIKVTIHTAKPGLVIGKKGSDIEKIKGDLTKIVKKEISLDVLEIKSPEIDALLIAESIAKQIEKRVPFRRAMKRAIQNALKSGALGIRINCSGRLGGAEIARMEWYKEGRVPLHTLRANVDYGTARANTTYGVIGIKAWVYKGDAVKQFNSTSE